MSAFFFVCCGIAVGVVSGLVLAIAAIEVVRGEGVRRE